MLLTRECDYAIRIIRALADGSKRKAKDINEEENIPHKFTYKISKKLEHAGLIKSIHGCEGGYQLNKTPDAFTLYDVICAVDKNIAINDCTREDKDCPLNQIDNNKPCKVHVELMRVQEMLIREMQRHTMQELL